MKTVTVAIDAVTVRERHRDAMPEKVAALAASMAKIGLQTPISVWTRDTADDVEIVLVAGLHRLEAARKLGWADIEAFDVELDEIDRELWEIDENLCRAELTEAQESLHLDRRKVLWAEKAKRAAAAEAGEKTSPSSLSDGRPAGPQHKQAFAAETAEATGQSKRSINQKIARAEAIGDDLQDVVGTSLDKGVELDALAKMPEPERKDIIARAKAGEHVTARRQRNAIDDKMTKDDATEQLANLLAEEVGGVHWTTLTSLLYASGSAPVAKAFQRIVGTPVFDNSAAGR